MRSVQRVHEWGADRGWWQYPLPRTRPRRPRIDHLGLRLVAGLLGLFGVIVFGAALIIMTIVFGVFIYAAVTT
jgi:hypothetical protein